MRASYNWLRELCGVDAPPEEYARRLTAAGLEVEEVESFGDGLDGVVIAEVRGRRPHPKRDKLSLVTVFDGEREQEVVCGAPNVPEPGGRVLFARLGARLPNGMQIAERAIGGVSSAGMICSEEELGLGADSAGIHVVAPSSAATPGAPVAEALGAVDTVFEIGVTPNRPDCLGHVGLAREVALLFERPFELPEVPPLALVPEAVEVEGHGRVAIALPDPDRCPRYGGAVVTGVTPGPSPFWLRYRLHCLGVRALSNVVDVTNLVMLENGHPIHGFDLARLRGRRVVVRRAAEGEVMATLDGVERVFGDDDLLICDGEGPVAVAGVMGGANSELGEDTRDVLIECAWFDPRSVRRTARRLGMHTDASHRFERGVDPGGVPRVMARAAHLMAELCGGTALPVAIDAHPRPAEPARVTLRPARLATLLGVEVGRDAIGRVLAGVGCGLTDGPDGSFEAVAPTWRPDIAREVDLIEEVARVVGYDAIPTRVPRVVPSEEGTPAAQAFVRRARELAAAAGAHEAITYAFVSPRELEAARVPTDVVALANPLSEERSVMRTSLLPGLAAAAQRAQRRQVDRVQLFEIAHVFHPSGEVLPREEAMLGALLLGPRPAWIGDDGALDFYDGKGLVEAIVWPLLGVAPEAVLDEGLEGTAPWLHPRRRAAVRVAGETVGSLGELHPDVVDALELVGRPVYVELSIDALLTARARVGVPQAAALPRFPSASRDIALLVDDALPAGEIARAVLEAASGLAESVELFDLYRGGQIPPGRKSLAFHVVYRDADDTLTDKRVDQVHGEVTRAVVKRFGATVR